VTYKTHFALVTTDSVTIYFRSRILAVELVLKTCHISSPSSHIPKADPTKATMAVGLDLPFVRGIY